MDRKLLEDHLSAVERQLVEVGRNVTNQRELVSQLEREGHDTDSPKRQLEQLEEVLTMHIAARDRIRKEQGLSE
jgi:recombinational DNA repair ATPase RecF